MVFVSICIKSWLWERERERETVALVLYWNTVCWYSLKSHHSSTSVHRIQELRVPDEMLMALDQPSKAVGVQYVQRHWVDSRESLREIINKMPSTQHNPTRFPVKFHLNRFGDHVVGFSSQKWIPGDTNWCNPPILALNSQQTIGLR